MLAAGPEMNGMQNKKAHALENPFPGCLGGMVNVFDLKAGAARNQLLTDKPHRDSSLSRSQSDVARISSPIGNQFTDMLMVPELRRNSSNGKLNGTPMKMLIAREMSREVESKHNSPNVVARLMGLEALPQGQPISAAQGIHSKGYSRDTQALSAMPLDYSQGKREFFDKQRQCEIYHCQEQIEFKDVYEIRQQSEKTDLVRDSSPGNQSSADNMNEKRMALIRQKFIEAKRLSTDEKLRQTKEFQDALELLNSNRDLLIKFLQESSSMFSQHLYEMRSSPPPQTRRITVLKPSKIVDNDKVAGSDKNAEKQMKKSVWTVQANGKDKSNHQFAPAFSSWKADDAPNPAQTTRIVVLKPSPGRTHDIKAMDSPPTLSPGMSDDGDLCGKPEDSEQQESREVAMEIAHHMHENLSGLRRDETLLSSVFSNGYIGDESSFNKSENEFEVGNLSDPEFMSPSSRHSWDNINRFDSPYPSSSYSRASFSPESSVCREAKKRLSERWAMMASNGIYQEQRHARRSSSTLGEMLALPDMNKTLRPDEGSSKGHDKGEGADDSPGNLLRSKSVPVSSTVYGDRLNVEISGFDTSKMHGSKELTKSKSTKSSFKGKVSSLFFSRNKKSSKEKSRSPSESHSTTSDTSPCANKNGLVESLPPHLHESVSKTSSPYLIGMELKQGIVSQELPLNAANSGNLEQPSPISVLVPPFEEDDTTTPESSGSIKQNQPGMQMRVHPAKSNLIDKSPLIEPMARRALSWDEYSALLATHTPNPRLASPRTEEEEDWLLLVQTLLSAAGLDSEAQPISSMDHWRSPKSLLGPSLRENFASLGSKGLMHEAKRRQWRSNRKLVFDCVDSALANIIGRESSASPRIGSRNEDRDRDAPLQGPLPMLVDRVLAQLKKWGAGEVEGDGGDRDSMVVESVVRMEVVGGEWLGRGKSEVEIVGQEIGSRLLEELMEETVVQLTGRV